jgi:hypothetical protein
MQVFCVGGKHFPPALGTLLEYAPEKIFYFFKKVLARRKGKCFSPLVAEMKNRRQKNTKHTL